MRWLTWFRSDLRVDDNSALREALHNARRGVVAVFLISTDQWRQHHWGPNKISFVLRNVLTLERALDRLGIPLHVQDCPRFAAAPATLLQLARRLEADVVAFNDEYEINERRRDDATAALLEREGIEVRRFDDQTIVRPDLLRTGAGGFYKVFTPFRKAWQSVVQDRLPLALGELGRGQARLKLEVTPAPQAIGDVAPDEVATLWPAGELEARRRLRQFVRDRIRGYRQQRDLPADDATSTLSPYLAAGVISPRRCLAEALDANEGLLDLGNEGVVTWISELCWREFYRHVMVGFPRVCMDQPFKPQARAIPWRQDREQFERWCRGLTGVPIVDAAMRQLQRTGWMHNRLRMVVAMYLTKDLLIDWRWGERFFMEQLVDGDLGNNNGGWQWSASTGTDAAPYFRIFNPVSQSRRYDPGGDFIRKWLPELAQLEDGMIHDPPALLRASLGYPEPMVDRATSRQRVLAAFTGM